MRDLYRALMIFAADRDGFISRIREVANAPKDPAFNAELKVKSDPADTLTINLSRQPTPTALERIAAEYRALGVYPSLYVVAEVNRWVVEDRDEFGGQATMELRRYWEGFGPLRSIIEERPALMEAAGALCVDPRLRSELVNTSRPDYLAGYGLEVSPGQQSALRSCVLPGSACDLAADAFCAFSWPKVCLVATVPWPGWFNVNM